jgi:hypothetical protein
MPYCLKQIISGGQTGVDQAALQVAFEMGYKTGGTAPLGYKTDEGPNPALLRDLYGLKESWSPGYRVRTMQNVRDADGTILFGHTESPGCRLTIDCCVYQIRPYVENPSVEELQTFLEMNRIRILNVAGNGSRTHPEAAELATTTLALALVDYSQHPLR